MVERHDGSALAACGNVGLAELAHNGDAKTISQGLAVAELDRQALLGPVEYRLAVKPHQIDLLRCSPFCSRNCPIAAT